MIYEALLVSKNPLPLHGTERRSILPRGSPVRILEVSRSIYRETKSILYGQNTFHTGLSSENKDHIGQWLVEIDTMEERNTPGPLWWDDRASWDDMKNEVSEIFNYRREGLLDLLGRMQSPSLLRQIGPTSTSMISRLCFNVCGIFDGVNQCLLWLELIRQHMPGLKALFIEFSRINCFNFYACRSASMSFYVDHAVEELFRALEQHLKRSLIFTHIEIAGEPTLVEMADALVQGKRTGHMPDVMDIWKQRVVDPGLLEVYYKYRHIYLPEWASEIVTNSEEESIMASLEAQTVLLEGSRSKIGQAHRRCNTVLTLVCRRVCSTCL